MKQHKYESLIKFIHLDGVKEFKETDPSLFSEDGITTCTLEVDNGKNAPVTLIDAKNACVKFLNKELSLFQFQQWGEWMHMMEFFDLIPNGEPPLNDETLINALTEIDNIDMLNPNDVDAKVNQIITNIDNWIENNQ